MHIPNIDKKSFTPPPVQQWRDGDRFILELTKPRTFHLDFDVSRKVVLSSGLRYSGVMRRNNGALWSVIESPGGTLTKTLGDAMPATEFVLTKLPSTSK